MSFDKYERKDAAVAVDSLKINCREQAAQSARNYLDVSGFSREGSIQRLTSFDKYTQAQAAYGASEALR